MHKENYWDFQGGFRHNRPNTDGTFFKYLRRNGSEKSQCITYLWNWRKIV